MQTEFNLLKKTTSKNIENLHKAINLQQTCTSSLCSHVNTIYTKLAQLEEQIQTHCLYPHSQTDAVQINALEYDLDINGHIDIKPQAPSHAENTEEDSAPVTANSKEYSALPQDSDRFEPQSKSVQNPAEHSPHQDTEQFRVQHEDRQRSQLEDIPELEDEDWEDGQFTDADLIDHHNTKTESNHDGNIQLILRSLQTRNITPRTIQHPVLITTSQSLSITIQIQDPSNTKHIRI